MDTLVGQCADISSSAYQYRADRAAEENPPESWLALMRYANQPLNKPLDVNAAAVKQALCGLLWEEIRPLQQVELVWATDATRRPLPEQLAITILKNQGSASSWWNNLRAVRLEITPTVSDDGTTYSYRLQEATCGIVISVVGDDTASDYSVPTVRALVANTWKSMGIEIEWAFDERTAAADYSGRIETYDGVVEGLCALNGDTRTTVTDAGSWRSSGKGSGRRGVALTLFYMGESRWRRVQPYTSQRADVARTIVTVWTKAGSFSFLAADLENGPILAPEYGFFVRRTTELPPREQQVSILPEADTVFAHTMDSIAGTKELLGWGGDECPWFGGNPADKPVTVSAITVPARRVAMHPGFADSVAVGWRSPIEGRVRITTSVAHGQAGGNGIEWWVVHRAKTGRTELDHGETDGKPAEEITAGDNTRKTLDAIAVEPGDMVSFVVGSRGIYACDTTIIEFGITEVGEQERVWDLTQDVVGSLHAGNPHVDSRGNEAVWYFYSEAPPDAPSEPPIELASDATSAAEFIRELRDRNLSTIRERIRAREEQTWEGAVAAMGLTDLPPHPKPPAEYQPKMRVEVPSERLTAQWNLGVWHLVRHCGRNPESGGLWFNDHPYGILAAETYLILTALDLMGSHEAAEDGFDQWVSLPMDTNSAGHNVGALPDRPNGLFSEGHGCLTHAVGPPGVGGHNDGVHAFGPGSIGWALTEHYWLSGDKEWLKAAAPRIKANAEWMLRQRKLMSSVVPGGERLWCKGLQPPLQVTPDSGGLWMQFHECEAYYWAAVSRLAATLAEVDPEAGAQLAAEAEAYGKDLLAAVERSIVLSPVVQVRDGTFHSVIPFACYVRGLATGPWGWRRDGSGAHVGPLYWETVQTAAPLISPAGLLSPQDVRVQGYLDVLEDRLLLENRRVGDRDWFAAGWQHQGGLERTSNVHLAADDVPVFLRSFLNCYAIDILPDQGYVFREHATGGPPDKVFEEAAFLERFRNMLLMEDGRTLWVTRGAPRAWFKQGERIRVTNAPTHFGTTGYEIVSDVDNGKISATIEMPDRNGPDTVLLRLRHPESAPIERVTVNGKDWGAFNPDRETIELKGLTGRVAVTAYY